MIEPTRLPVKVVGDDGKEIVRPDVVAFVSQLAELGQVTKLRKIQESKIPVGLATEEWTINGKGEYAIDPPWLSFSLINDGPDPVYIMVNKLTLPLKSPVAVDGTLEIDFDYPIINRLFFVCASDTLSTVRIRAEEGKWA